MKNINVKIEFNDFAIHFNYSNFFYDFLETINTNVRNQVFENKNKIVNTITFETNINFLKSVLIPEFKSQIDKEFNDKQKYLHLSEGILFSYKLDSSKTDVYRKLDNGVGYSIVEFKNEIEGLKTLLNE